MKEVKEFHQHGFLSIGLNPDRIRKDLLEVLGNQTQFGAEDQSLCAFIAWRGTAA